MPRAVLAIALLALLASASAQDALRTERLVLAAGTPFIASETIGGFETVDYVITLRAGQNLDVVLDTTNLSNCFDITAPGAEKPFFAGGESGNRHNFQADAAGDYVIRVYLLRLAARDYQSAEYTLTVTLGE